MDSTSRVLERRAFILMTVATSAWGLTGCAGRKKEEAEPPTPLEGLSKAFSKLKKRVRKHVADKSKHDPLEELIDDAEQDFVNANVHLGDWRYSMSKLPPDKRFDRDLLVSMTTEYNDKIRQSIKDACDKAVRARSMIQESEWALVFPGKKGA